MSTTQKRSPMLEVDITKQQRIRSVTYK